MIFSFKIDQIQSTDTFSFKKWQTRNVVEEHNTRRPFLKNYSLVLTWWKIQCIEFEAFESTRHRRYFATSKFNEKHDQWCAFEFVRHNFNDLLSSLMKGKIGQNMAHDRDNAEFYELLKDGNQQLCKWCTKYLKLSFPVNLYLIKCLCIQNCHFLLR